MYLCTGRLQKSLKIFDIPRQMDYGLFWTSQNDWVVVVCVIESQVKFIATLPHRLLKRNRINRFQALSYHEVHVIRTEKQNS